MEDIRFERFTLLIDGIHKCIHKIKLDTVGDLGIKSVHVFWLYILLNHPEGITAGELARASMVDRSLVSREIRSLSHAGYAIADASPDDEGRRGYNSKIFLTDKGKELASRIAKEVVNIQQAVDEGISEADLLCFYKTLEKLHDNFIKMTTPTGKREI